MNNKKTFLKKLSVGGIAFSAMGLANLSFAAAPPAAPPAGGADSSMVVAAINDLNHNIEKLAYAKSMSKNGNDYQYAASLALAAKVNTGKNQAQVKQYPDVQGVSAIAQKQAGSLTENQNKSNLTAFSDTALTYTTVSADVSAAQDRNKARQNIIDQLSWKTKASDSLYSDLFTASADIQKPKTLHDNYFNFSSLIQPMAYTADQETAAKNFITYLTQKYQSFSDNIDFGKLRNYLLTLQNKPEKLDQALKSITTSSSYEQYQLSARALISERSVALNNLNQLVAERSPIITHEPNPGLAQVSQAIGVTPATTTDPNTNKTVYIYASPLQISNYVTTHRTSDPQWYQQMTAASPATVQRETLFVMAEMEAEMQRQHLDNERILATLSASQMQNVVAQEGALKPMANDVNQQIATLTGNGGSSAISPLNASGPNPTTPPSGMNSMTPGK
jgi:intracellular multiplication protein IcmX